MSFQAYLDSVEKKTGLTPRQLLDLAKQKGYDAPEVKAGTILAWLKEDYELGRGHGMAMVQLITKGPVISDKHVGFSGPHGDKSQTLWLDGAATNPH